MIGSLASDENQDIAGWNDAEGGVLELLGIHAHGVEIIGAHDRASRDTLVAVLTNLANIF
eukprot:scaffold595406_cov63-Attheya_sp.AAC.2